MTNLPIPKKIVMRKTSELYPFLLKDRIYIIPENYADLLISREEADLCLEIDETQDPIIFGERRFLDTQKAKRGKSEAQKSIENAEEKKKTSLFIDEKYMYEQIKKSNGQFAFIQYNFETGELKEIPFIDSSEQPLYPIDDEEAVRDFIKLPSGVEEYGTEEQLIERISNHLNKYLDVPEQFLKMAVFNIMKSWVFQRFHSINYLRFRGEPGSGKSRGLDAVGHLHYKVIATTGATTVAPVFRIINKWNGSLSIDEADIAQGDETNDMIKIINQGFEKDKPVMRCNPDDKAVIDFFDVYCPKVLSTRRQFKDFATETRCITHIMTGTNRQDIPSSLNDEYAKETATLRNMLLLWRFRRYTQINPNVGETLDWKGIEPRLKQVLVGFIALFDNNQEFVNKFMQYVRTMQKEIKQERSGTPEGMIVQAIMDLLLNKEYITASAIISKSNLTDDRGNTWKPQKLAPYMKTLGFHATVKKRIGDEIQKLYFPEGQHLHNLFVKFIPEDELKEQYALLLPYIQNNQVGHTYSDLFVSLCPCVTSLMVRPEQVTNQAENGCVPVSLFTYRQVTQGNRDTEKTQIDKLLENGDLVEIEPNTYKKVI